MTDIEIGKKINKDRGTVYVRRKKLGLIKEGAKKKSLTNSLPKKQRIQVLMTAASIADKCEGNKSATVCSCEHCKKARRISEIFDYPERYEEMKEELLQFK